MWESVPDDLSDVYMVVGQCLCILVPDDLGTDTW